MVLSTGGMIVVARVGVRSGAVASEETWPVAGDGPVRASVAGPVGAADGVATAEEDLGPPRSAVGAGGASSA